jgi:hypothetical protein
MIAPDGPQMTIRYAAETTQDTNTHSYVILTAVTRQQGLDESALI